MLFFPFWSVMYATPPFSMATNAANVLQCIAMYYHVLSYIILNAFMIHFNNPT